MCGTTQELAYNLVVGLWKVSLPREDGVTICMVGESIVEDMLKCKVLDDVSVIADWGNEDAHSCCSDRSDW